MKRARFALSRRSLLQGLGMSGVLAPFLPILNASGQEMVFPKRLLLFYSPDGTSSIDHGGAATDWKPQGTETAFTLAATHAPLEPYKSRLVVPWGMRFSAGGAGQEHAFGMSGLWSGATLNGPSGDANFDGGNGNRTGWGSGPSVDQMIAEAAGPELPYQRAVTDAQQDTAYRTLELGVQCLGPDSKHRMIYKGANQPLHPEVNPKAVFDRLFGMEPQEPGVTDATVLRKRAQLAALMQQTESLRSRVGAQEYEKIDAHLSGLSALDKRLNGPTTTVGCAAPMAPAAGTANSRENSAAFPAECTAMMDLVTHAFACDLTRVASLQLSRGFSNITHSWAGVNQGHHTVSHNDGDNRAALTAIDVWYAKQFAYLLQQLDAVKEGDGTLLDNTLVVWGREMGQTNHRMSPMPLVFAGGARGGLVTGRFLDRSKEPHAKALVSICRLMGLDVNSMGNRDMNSGPLAGIG